MNTRKLVFLSLLVALGTALHVLEAMLPNPLPFPGVKLGLANVVTLLALYLFGFRSGLAVAVLRVLTGSLLSGTIFSITFMMSLSGAVLSTIVMACLFRRSESFSILGVSMAGAVMHNIGQLLLASYLIETRGVFYYLPVLIIVGLPTGFLTGYISRLLIRRLKEYVR